MGRQPKPWGGGSGAGGGGGYTRPDLKVVYKDLPSLADAVANGAAEWAAERDVSTLCGAFNLACKLGMSPGQQPHDDDPQRAALLHRTVATLAAVYLPLVPGLRAAKWCVIPLWACAKAGYWGGGLADALLWRLGRDAGALMRQANGQDHGNVWWSLSEAPEEVIKTEHTEAVLDASGDRLQQMQAASSKDTRKGLLAADLLQPQECANVLLACARLQRSPIALLHHMTACLAAQPDATCQPVANSLYALGELFEDCGHMPRPQDLQRLAATAVERLAGKLQGTGRPERDGGGDVFIPQHLSNILLGCAKLGYTNPDLLLPLAAECKRRNFTSFNAQTLFNAVWALAKMGYNSDQAWFAAAVAAAVRPGVAQELKAQEWSNLWYGLVQVQHRPNPAFLKSTLAASEVLRTQANGQECANLLWSLATLKVPYEPRLVDVLVGRLVELLPQNEVNVQNLANSVWALAVMGPSVLFRQQRPVEALLREAVRRWDGADGGAGDGRASSVTVFNLIDLAQLWRVQQELEHADGCGELAGIMASARGLLSAARRAASQ
ncbi:hypothetical protein TSOC_010355 [Tetrabaena socialis]|uniref:Uncharacterized protein n=1 Tax=Tetrabaena socialis TaxID=47790 RepID=A0A2J7ZTL4_9CHLO|nr:hypothetical protein TSOC_010355 [Tetrabaena socialis]|eukprot:PNH03580.1 hypothetical protein TSOC_010355 [Tetrabaena socialis]